MANTAALYMNGAVLTLASGGTSMTYDFNTYGSMSTLYIARSLTSTDPYFDGESATTVVRFWGWLISGYGLLIIDHTSP